MTGSKTASDPETGEYGSATGEASSRRPSTIVVGYATNPEGRAALDYAVLAGTLSGATIIVVHTSAGEELSSVGDVLERSGLRYELRRAGDDRDPSEELITISEESASAMIVIGLRRRSPVGKLLLGNSAQRVLLDASCPVLAVKADGSDQTAAGG
jgi:nucleotide-binding universal stress UspA family protein